MPRKLDAFELEREKAEGCQAQLGVCLVFLNLIRDRVQAAVRAGVRTVVLPAENAPEARLVTETMTGPPEIVLAADLAQALATALEQGLDHGPE